MIENPRVKTIRHVIVYAILTAGAIVMMVPLALDRHNFAEDA